MKKNFEVLTRKKLENNLKDEITLIKERLNFYSNTINNKGLPNDYLLIIGQPSKAEVEEISVKYKKKIIIVVAKNQKAIMPLINSGLTVLFFYRPIISVENDTNHIKNELKKLK